MRQEVLDFIKNERVGVLAVEMLDGSPHAATVHFAHADEPFAFFFETNRDYRKSEALFGRDVTRASFVVGAAENTMRTLQLDGFASLLKPEEKEVFESVYLGKFPEKAGKAKGDKVVFFTFTPTWWRFTDWKAPGGKMILTSE